eukprot:SAG31_NODE_3406_length_4308_cov_2.231884_5_plen_100_part_00
MVWEGVNTTIILEAGMATVSLTTVGNDTTSCTPSASAAAVGGGPLDWKHCLFGNRNVDVVMLHPNSSDVEHRLTSETKILPLDGLLSQAGEGAWGYEVT